MPQTATKQYLAQTRELFYCQCKVKLPLEIGEAMLDECFMLMEYVDKTYNSYQLGSYFDRINQHAGEWVEVDETTVDLIHTLKLVSRLTGGAYDITAMPLLKLWGFYNKRTVLPTQEEIDKTLKKVDYSTVSIDGNRVRIEAGQEIVTGSFLKAFAVDLVVELLRKNGVSDAIINAGGSTIFALTDETHPAWNITIPGVSDVSGQRVQLSNQGFNLSGKQHNQLEIEGTSYGHILNAATGMPSEAAQVGVLSDTAFIGDVVSTALFSVKKEQLQPITERLHHHFSFDFYRIEQNGTTVNAFNSLIKI